MRRFQTLGLQHVFVQNYMTLHALINSDVLITTAAPIATSISNNNVLYTIFNLLYFSNALYTIKYT